MRLHRASSPVNKARTAKNMAMRLKANMNLVMKKYLRVLIESVSIFTQRIMATV